MQRYFWKFVMAIAIFGCFEISEKPKILLDKNQMSEVLYLIYINKNYAIVNENTQRTKDYDLKMKILQEMNIPEKVFNQSLDYYALHPDQNKQILEIVQTKIETEKFKDSKPKNED